MAAVMIELTTRQASDEELDADAVVMVDDVEALSTFNRCSCSVGDDQPY